MCGYVGGALALANIYGAEQDYKWNVDVQNRKYEHRKRELAHKAEMAGKTAASKMLRSKLEAEREREKLSEAQLELIIQLMQEQSAADAEAFAKGKKGQSVDATKRQLTSANLREMTKITDSFEDLRLYLSQQISDSTEEWKYNLDSVDIALEGAKLEKEEAIGDYNLVRVGHLVSLAQGYITDKQLGDDWKMPDWFKGKPSPTPQQDAMARRWDVKAPKSRTNIRLSRSTDPLYRYKTGKG
tara:strand:- start:388 stop:1113 length:726 start_codon:yes stop_codon:yes gene_type:complete